MSTFKLDGCKKLAEYKGVGLLKDPVAKAIQRQRSEFDNGLRSKSCDRAKESMVKTFKISSDKIQANLSKFSNSIHNRLDEKGKCKLSVNCISSEDFTTDFYKPAADEPDYEDLSAGFCEPEPGCT